MLNIFENIDFNFIIYEVRQMSYLSKLFEVEGTEHHDLDEVSWGGSSDDSWDGSCDGSCDESCDRFRDDSWDKVEDVLWDRNNPSKVFELDVIVSEAMHRLRNMIRIREEELFEFFQKRKELESFLSTLEVAYDSRIAHLEKFEKNLSSYENERNEAFQSLVAAMKGFSSKHDADNIQGEFDDRMIIYEDSIRGLESYQAIVWEYIGEINDNKCSIAVYLEKIEEVDAEMLVLERELTKLRRIVKNLNTFCTLHIHFGSAIDYLETLKDIEMILFTSSFDFWGRCYAFSRCMICKPEDEHFDGFGSGLGLEILFGLDLEPP